jgi:hypothetical protein
MSEMDNVNIDPRYVKELWHALFAVTHAVEHFGHQEQVNSLFNDETNLGAYDYARMVLRDSVVKNEE